MAILATKNKSPLRGGNAIFFFIGASASKVGEIQEFSGWVVSDFMSLGQKTAGGVHCTAPRPMENIVKGCALSTVQAEPPGLGYKPGPLECDTLQPKPMTPRPS